jgi:predicted AAA+ superfamily ATPase
MENAETTALLARIAAALERIAPPAPPPFDPTAADAFVWQADPPALLSVPKVNAVPLALLQGIGPQIGILRANTERFAAGLPANNALLWGARGMGKSSLVEIHREDISTLPTLLNQLRGRPEKFLMFCDDLSFDAGDSDYKSLKAVLDGGVEGRPANVLLYATSNRRHLMARDMIENERSTAINPGEAVEEKVSLSDRFGLWLGFHHCDQDTFFAMVEGYAGAMQLPISTDALRAAAREWQVTRGSRSGRVAWQFIQDLAGRLGVPLG